MARSIKKPFICENCDHVCQHKRVTTTKDGEQIRYIEVVHVDGMPRLGLKIGLCMDCENLTKEGVA